MAKTRFPGIYTQTLKDGSVTYDVTVTMNGKQKQMRKVVGLPTLRFQDLRHAQATLLARAGVHPRIAQDRLGHASAQLTMDVYTHVSAGDQAPATAAVEGLLMGGGE